MSSPDGPAAGTAQLRFRITGNEGLNADCEGGSGFFYSHPKLCKLEEVVVEHFREHQCSNTAAAAATTSKGTRVMIFSQYRESVQEIADMLSQHHPLIKVMSFVGHSTRKSNSKGLTQKEQTEVLYPFSLLMYG